MRPNFAQDAPPTSMTIGGIEYQIDTDYRTWLDVIKRMEKLDFRSEARREKTLEELAGIEEEVFGKLLDADLQEVMEQLSAFIKGYPEAPTHPTDHGRRTFSYEYDLNAIIIAIRNQSGIDLSYKCKNFHWWLFLLEFRTLCGEHYILNLMQARGYDGSDKELIRRRNACALPEEYTEEEIEEYKALDALFR